LFGGQALCSLALNTFASLLLNGLPLLLEAVS
jgi:hypothetical protein